MPIRLQLTAPAASRRIMAVLGVIGGGVLKLIDSQVDRLSIEERREVFAHPVARRFDMRKRIALHHQNAGRNEIIGCAKFFLESLYTACQLVRQAEMDADDAGEVTQWWKNPIPKLSA